MKIIINCGLMASNIISLLENYEGEAKYKLKSIEGIKMIFDVQINTDHDIVALTKQIIRSTPIGKNLIFQVMTE